MAVKITLPKRFAKSPVLAGIEFTDGVATVDKLGSSARAYFEHVGASFADPDAPNTAPVEELTVAELRGRLERAGVDIPAKANKAALADLYVAHVAGEQATPEQE
jgi:hypothetical protein